MSTAASIFAAQHVLPPWMVEHFQEHHEMINQVAYGNKQLLGA